MSWLDLFAVDIEMPIQTKEFLGGKKYVNVHEIRYTIGNVGFSIEVTHFVYLMILAGNFTPKKFKWRWFSFAMFATSHQSQRFQLDIS